ncbi:heat-inducible transcriptional repressor HrcA [Synechococcales cyanobacterium C]|uniref:Heat-inducible transcription repressor HrcA n=1 Tax=Petrachloros mirabilis ULC683 TaxID=2781853 RepID=A0A8K2A0J4_9CYAN|nr:heat-inducible transcriptional repressor HrcA [Petrachloros mirabilis]NCJ07513.1 heat-inducible transcriptional repressor HrcA [Petrachloros mirabilis ULC683]
MKVQLTKRQQQVLRATIQYYIATAEPVGSKALAQEYQLPISPATIRNVMGVLEKSGLLYQPHISAGRVPSDSGYRIYVDELMRPASQMVQRVEQVLTERLRPMQWGFEAMLRHAAQVLATLSGCVALITMPRAPATTIRHLQLVQIEAQRVMLIVVTDTYEIQSVLVDLPEFSESEPEAGENLDRELQILSNFLNHQFTGCTLGDLATLDWQTIEQQFRHYTDFLQALLRDLTQRNAALQSNQILIGGLAEVLRQPEFAELHQAQTIIHLLEENQDQLLPLIWEWTDVASFGGVPQQSRQRVSIRIGAENPLEPIQTCALISSTYQKGKIPVGSVGILGPTRMAYEEIIAMVEVMADYLTECLSQGTL